MTARNIRHQNADPSGDRQQANTVAGRKAPGDTASVAKVIELIHRHRPMRTVFLNYGIKNDI